MVVTGTRKHEVTKCFPFQAYKRKKKAMIKMRACVRWDEPRAANGLPLILREGGCICLSKKKKNYIVNI